MFTLKTLTFSLIALIAIHQATWITRCENLWGPGLTYDARTTQKCEMIWKGLSYQAINK